MKTGQKFVSDLNAKKEVMNKIPIVVTGVQRSGTSVVAGILFYLGVYMGDRFLKRDKYNPLGYFENIEFGDIDNALGEGAITKKKWQELFKDKVERYRNLDVALLGFERWGWKSPSTASLAKDVMDIAKPDMIWCERDKDDVLDSMKNMHWEGIEASLFKCKTEGINKVKNKVYTIKFEDLLENSNYEIGRLVEYLKLKPTKKKVERAIRHVVRSPDVGKPPETESYQNYL